MAGKEAGLSQPVRVNPLTSNRVGNNPHKPIAFGGYAARGGIQHATAGLFKARPWILTPQGEASDGGAARLVDFVQALGARQHVMTPAAHDHLVAFISHVPQIVASSLMLAVGDEVRDEGLALAGNGLADTTRLASSPATIWADICSSNADEIGPALDRVVAVLQHARANLTDRQAVAEIFDVAAAWRERLPPRHA